MRAQSGFKLGQERMTRSQRKSPIKAIVKPTHQRSQLTSVANEDLFVPAVLVHAIQLAAERDRLVLLLKRLSKKASNATSTACKAGSSTADAPPWRSAVCRCT